MTEQPDAHRNLGPSAWPELHFEALGPTIGYLQRLMQIAGKYTLDEPFEPGWGNVVFDVSPRGLRTPTLRRDGVTFSVYYRLLDGDVVIEADSGVRVLPLRDQSVAEFYTEFVAAAQQLGVPPPGSTVATEIPGAHRLDADHLHRRWDEDAARLIWTGLAAADGALKRWQAAYRGHRPRVGVMWGGFDLSATRYRGVKTDPPPDRPIFMQHGMREEYLAVGFSFGSPESPLAAMYAYIAPQPEGLAGRGWGVEGAAWMPQVGLVVLPWATLRMQPDPAAAIVAFGDAVYEAAVETAGWSADLLGARHDGWHASRTPPARD